MKEFLAFQESTTEPDTEYFLELGSVRSLIPHLFIILSL